MSRYIDQDKVIDAVLELDTTHRVSWLDAVMDMIDAMPPEDVQPVVRCKDCRWFIPDEVIRGEGMCNNLKAWVVATSEDFGCIHGKRKGADK